VRQGLSVAPGLVLIAVLAGCGYTTESSLPARYQTVHVRPFENESREYDLEAPLTNALSRKFITDGRLRVADRAHADLLLEGAILDYRLRGLTYDDDDRVTQFLVVLAANARLLDTATSEVIWEEKLMSGETTYYTRAAGQSADRLRGNAEAFVATVNTFPSPEENRAAAEALEQLASDIFYRTVEPF
jgi:hypothetical protein